MFILTSVISVAQVQTYRATQYAFATINSSTGKYYWGDWEKSSVLIVINTEKDLITIYSQRTQIYAVYDSYNNGNIYTDSSGGKNIKFYVIDQDGDKGDVRLRVEKNGNSQIYVEFKDCAWV